MRRVPYLATTNVLLERTQKLVRLRAPSAKSVVIPVQQQRRVPLALWDTPQIKLVKQRAIPARKEHTPPLRLRSNVSTAMQEATRTARHLHRAKSARMPTVSGVSPARRRATYV